MGVVHLFLDELFGHLSGTIMLALWMFHHLPPQLAQHLSLGPTVYVGCFWVGPLAHVPPVLPVETAMEGEVRTTYPQRG